MTTPHLELEELLGAYVLDAVDPDERAAVERHLPVCPKCRAEVIELREVTALLANVSTPAPEGVWDNIVASLEEAPPPLRLSIVPSAPTQAPPPSFAARVSRRRASIAAVAAIAAVVIGVLGFAIGRTGTTSVRPDTSLAAAATSALGEPGSRNADLLSTTDQAKQAVAVVRGNGEGYLLGGNLPAVDDRIYQLWGLTPDGAAVSLGVLQGPGVIAFAVDDTIQMLMLTKEQHAVEQPSTPPVVQGNLV
ncbi:MAG: anti-sigma factor [Acidimicrobiales bacterium]